LHLEGWDAATENYDPISLSNSTVKQQIEDVADNVKSQLLKEICNIEYRSLQTNESMHASNSVICLHSFCRNVVVHIRFSILQSL
jgi:hypothetical protein